MYMALGVGHSCIVHRRCPSRDGRRATEYLCASPAASTGGGARGWASLPSRNTSRRRAARLCIDRVSDPKCATAGHTVNHEILGDNFKPVDDGFTREDMLIVRSAQANSNPVICKPIKETFRHILFRSLD